MKIIYIDGAARGNPGPAGYGICVTDAEGEVVDRAYGYIGKQTNNVAEYTALIAALQHALNNDWKSILVRSDSQLMVKQLSGEYRVKNEVLAGFYRRALQLLKKLDAYQIEHVKREKNKCADKMANIAVDEKRSDPEEINPIMVKKDELF